MDRSLWVEKYRPKNVNDCILPDAIKKIVDGFIEKQSFPNLLITGTQGNGKTSLAKALCNELDLTWELVNASNERGMDVIRNRAFSFANMASLSGQGKCFILDEADHLLPDTQAALRSSSEDMSAYCSFIMTANYPNKIIEPIKSRFMQLDFNNVGADEREHMMIKVYQRMIHILENEGKKFDEDVLLKLVLKFYPDTRKLINLLEGYCKGSDIVDAGIFLASQDLTIEPFVDGIKNKEFKAIQQWAVNNSTSDTSVVYDTLYRALKPMLIGGDSISNCILTINDYQRYDTVVASKELHLVALGVELMTLLEFK